ncbi:MAG TPA: P-loop NTPase fold protein [Pyrinomonadaceae bacterium]|jgi:hypothetical protein
MEANNYWFYLSYSRSEDNSFIKRFYLDLCRDIARLVGSDVDPEQLGFFKSSSIEMGEEWERSVAEAISTCRTFVCLYSPGYFKSEYCGKEFQIFLDRVRTYKSPADGLGSPRFIFSILWDGGEQLQKSLPDVAAKLQYVPAGISGLVSSGGLYPLMKAGMLDEGDYYQFLQRLSKSIVNEAKQLPLPPIHDIPPLNSIQSAFHTTKPPEEMPDGEPETTPKDALKVEDNLDNFPLSPTTQKIVTRAAELAEDGPMAFTTSCLLFAFEAEGIKSGHEGARRFISRQFAEVPKPVYGKVISSYFNQASHFPPDNPNRSAEMSAAAGTVTQNVLAIFDEAKKYSERTPNDGLIHGRHILAALLMYSPESGETGAHERLRELNIEIKNLREQFYENLKQQSYLGEGAGKDDPLVWQLILFPERFDEKSRLPAFDADVDSETDLLGIDDDVNGFAALIAARSVKPPLSIGLFGDWGSGKSFFMRRLRKRISNISREARSSPLPQSQLAFYRRIAQIEFNAWHYSESNLWASLVEYIFQNLRISDDEKKDILKTREESLLKDLELEEKVKEQILVQEKEAEEKLKQKQEELKQVERDHERKTNELARLSAQDVISNVILSVSLDTQVTAQVNAVLATAGITSVGTSAKEVQSAVGEARRVFERSSNLLTPLLKAKDKRKRFILLLIILLAAPLIGFIAALIMRRFWPELGSISAYVTGAATLLSTGALWVRKQAAWMSEWLNHAESAKQKVDSQIDAQMAQLHAQNAIEIAQHKQELELLKTKYAALRGESEEAQQRLDQIRTELTQNTAASLLARFIQDRAASDDYRKYLGLLALIRRDFERLSDLIVKRNDELLQITDKDKEEETAPLNRIVLYIDDLDRCTPRQVVTVLQAVHLLLAFPLFVVVVGVDVRWVAHALRKQYPSLMGQAAQKQAENTPIEDTDPRATPHDYLEKIFQIPFWLNPLEVDTTKKMVTGLMPVTKAVVQPKLESKEQETKSIESGGGGQDSAVDSERKEDSKASGSGAEVEKAGGKESTEGQTGTHIQQTTGSSQTTATSRLDLNPDNLDILPDEVTFVHELTPLMGRSPRAVKRFINTYRLLKAGLTPNERAAFLDETVDLGQFRIVLFLLSIITGLPSISREVFQLVIDASEKNAQLGKQNGRSKKKPATKLSAVLARSDNALKEPNYDEWVCLLNWIETYQDGKWAEMDIEKLVVWIPKLARYSFNIRGL